jgi:peptide chain release factor 3
MVLDAAKGIEPQTLKLFEVCRLRDIPIVTFINKMDREAQDPFALLDEIAVKLQLDPAPLFWPAGSGGRFKGMIDLREQRFIPYRKKGADGEDEGHPDAVAVGHNSIVQYLDQAEQAEVQEGAELVQEAAKPFDPQSVPRRPHDADLLRQRAQEVRSAGAARRPWSLCAAAQGGGGS